MRLGTHHPSTVHHTVCPLSANAERPDIINPLMTVPSVSNVCSPGVSPLPFPTGLYIYT